MISGGKMSERFALVSLGVLLSLERENVSEHAK